MTNQLRKDYQKMLTNIHLRSLMIIMSSFLFAHAQFFSIASPFYLPFLFFISIHFPQHRSKSVGGALLGALFLNVGQFFIICLQLLLFFILEKLIKTKSFYPINIIISFFIGQCIWQFLYYSGLPPANVLSAVLLEWLLVIVLTILIVRVNMLWPISFQNHLTDEQIVFAALYSAIVISGMSSFQIGAIHLGLICMHFIICALAYYEHSNRALLFATVIGLFYSISGLQFSAMISVIIATSIAVIFTRELPRFFASMASIIPSLLFFFYDQTLPLDIVYFTSIFIAATLFYAIPFEKKRVSFETLPREDEREQAVPTKMEPAFEATQQVRSLLQFAYEMLTRQSKQQPSSFTDEVPILCRQCIRFSYCYNRNENQIKQSIENWHVARRRRLYAERLKMEQVLARKCIKPQALIEELNVTSMEEQLWIQSAHGKQMIALQIQDFLKYLEQAVFELEMDAKKVHFFIEEEDKPIRFQYEVKVFSKAKHKYDVSGDAFHVFPLNERFVCILLSDGMGHADAASEVSRRIVQYMRRLLEHRIEPETAMHTLHYLFSMQFGQETYATLDVSLIDLQEGMYYCWKAGCMSTYIGRGGEVFNVNSLSPPIGAIPQFYTEMCTHQIKSNDMIWIVSDGLFSMDNGELHQEEIFKRLAGKLSRKSLSVHASLYELVDQYEYQFPFNDDCTVIAIRLKHNEVAWQPVSTVI